MWYLRLIPQHVNNRTVLTFLDFLRKGYHFCGRLPGINGRRKRRIAEHRRINEEILQLEETQYTEEAPERSSIHYFEQQNRMTGLRLGRKDMQYAGCGILALCNFLRSYGLGRKNENTLPHLIEEMEKRGLVAGALFGTSPRVIEEMLKERGFVTNLVSDEASFQEIFSLYDRFIMTFYHDGEDIREQMHTVFVSRHVPGNYYSVHNAECSGSRIVAAQTFRELMEALPGGRAKAICLIAADRKEED